MGADGEKLLPGSGTQKCEDRISARQPAFSGRQYSSQAASIFRRMASCIVKGCSGRSPDRKLHPFPRNMAAARSWLQRGALDSGDTFCRHVITSQAYRMCSLHFTPDCYLDSSRGVLRDNALPTVFPATPLRVNIKQEDSPLGRDTPTLVDSAFQHHGDTDSMSPHEQEMTTDSTPKCFVIGCPNSAEDQPLYPGVTLHTFPTDVSQVKVWLQHTGRHLGDPDRYAGHIPSNWQNLRMCSSHFGPDSYHIRGSAADLRPDAVPTIFPKLENPPMKEEDGEECVGADLGCDPAFMDEERGVRHVGTATDPLWGVRSVGILTRPILVKEASTCISPSRFGKSTKMIRSQRPTAEKGVQCVTHELNGDTPRATADYYQAGPFLTPGEMGLDEPLFGVHPHWGEERGMSRTQCGGSAEGIPVRDSRLFLALEDVLISLMQHLVSSSFIEENAKLTTHRILRQTLEIIGLLTGDKWMIAEKDDTFGNSDEVPVKCGDVGVYFSPDEWDYIEAHKEVYIDIIPDDPLVTESPQDLASGEESGSEDEAKASSDLQNSPEWKPQSEASESELSTDDDDSDDSKKRKTEDAFLGNPEIRMEYSADGRSRTFWCLKCNISCKDRRSFRSHLKTRKHLNFRADEEEATCEDCSLTFSSRSALIKHRAENHASKRYACTICGLEYDYVSQWIIHQRAHTGEKPFECDKCGKRFGHKCTLLVHHRRHTKGKTVKCSKCDRRFDTKSQLSKHERIHVPKKPFKCPVCGKQFEQKSLFTKHKWEHEEDAKRDLEVIKQAHEEGAAPSSPPRDVPQVSSSEQLSKDERFSLQTDT